jgi:translation initiation factor 1 (eIF-1/SUI1)
MERMVSERRGIGAGSASVVLESVITVQGDHVEALLAAFRRAGFDAVDTGERVTTEEGVARDAEVRLRVPV